VEVQRGHEHVPAEPTVVAIGNFDGVHVGHRALLDRARSLAATHNARVVALTFDPHPSATFGRAPVMLASMERRVELLGEAGADRVIVEPFTRELASRDPEEFVGDIVIGALHARAIVVGYDFKYGARRTGTTETLVAHGERAGVGVAIVPVIEVGGEVASSTRIRAHLAAGELAAAERLLGRRWDVDGIVVHGAERGRTIGVPTANVATSLVPLPIKPGIYAVTLDGMPAVASLGTNPTFVDGGALVLEAHVLDWSGDLYDRRVRVGFVGWLRDEAKFDGIEPLVAQIKADIAAARALF
jgi:riboflavin kinase / FMN adenylyltransferase